MVEPWAAAMIAAKLVDPRNGRPSMRALAVAADTTTSTVSHMMAGTRDTGGDVIQRIAEALNMGDRANKVTRWVGHARTAPKPFVAHRDADLLTSEEQEAVNELIRLMALPKKRGGAEDVSPAATKTPDSGPGTVHELVTDDEQSRAVAEAGRRAAARKGQSKGKQQKREADAAGEESQDGPDVG